MTIHLIIKAYTIKVMRMVTSMEKKCQSQRNGAPSVFIMAPGSDDTRCLGQVLS